MAKKLTQEEVEKRLQTTNIKLLSYFTKTQNKHDFLCFCGKSFSTNLCRILNRRTKSCGCIQGAGSKSPTWKGCGEIGKTYWEIIKNGAKIRNFEFNITIEYIWDLFLRQNRKCALSSMDIGFSSNYKSIGSGKQTASLDRIDSSKGYMPNNVQWVHKDINFMKNNFNEEHFLELVKNIYENKLSK